MQRQAIFGRLAGYEDVNDANAMRIDPARLARADPGPHTAVRRAVAVGTSWLTTMTERNVCGSNGNEGWRGEETGRNRRPDGVGGRIVIPAFRESSHAGTKRREKGRSARIQRFVRL